MKKLVISALALGAMTSVAFAEEPLKPTTGQPMQLSLAQLDDVTAGGRWGHKKKRANIKVNVVAFKIDQENEAEVEQESEVKVDDIKGNCKNCTIYVDGSNNSHLEQDNEVEFEIKF
jgi:hypothetical protein